LIHALNHLPPDARARLQSLLRCENYTDEMIAAARELFTRSGSIDYLQRSIDLYTSEALRALEKITPSPWRDLLEKLALYLVNREK
jgi:geranylgeranyl pyrophosphate synthase